MRSNHTVRLNGAGRYASGLLITTELIDAALTTQKAGGTGAERPHISARATFILTAAHFLRGPAGNSAIKVRSSNFSGTAGAHMSVFGTDIGVLRLLSKAPTVQLPSIAAGGLSIGQSTITYGFGGKAQELVPKQLHGRVLTRIPGNISRNRFTRVRHGALVLNTPDPAVRGDSGGPVLAGGLVYGVQSMITDPFGFNTGIATIASLAEHLPAIKLAMEQLS